MRIKTKWHKKDKAKSLEDLAAALGFIAWRIAEKDADNLYNAGFNFAAKPQLLAVVGEFVAFLLQLSDRLVYERLDDEQRGRFITALAQHLANTMADNLAEHYGPGDYRAGFVARLNERLEGYAELSYVGNEPGYQVLRYLGQCIDEIIGGKENKWVIEQVVDIEAPEAIKNLKKGLNDLFAQWDDTQADATAS